MPFYRENWKIARGRPNMSHEIIAVRSKIDFHWRALLLNRFSLG